MTSHSRTKKVAQAQATGTIPNVNASLLRRLEELGTHSERIQIKLLAAQERIKAVTSRNVQLREQVAEYEATKYGKWYLLAAVGGALVGLVITHFVK